MERTVTGRQGENIVIGRKGEISIIDEAGRVRSRFGLPYGAKLFVDNGAAIKQGATIFTWDPYSDQVISWLEQNAPALAKR